MVKIKDVHGQSYSVPLNSSVDFGIVYDREGSGRGSDEGLAGVWCVCMPTVISSSVPPHSMTCMCVCVVCCFGKL